MRIRLERENRVGDLVIKVAVEIESDDSSVMRIESDGPSWAMRNAVELLNMIIPVVEDEDLVMTGLS